METTKFDQLIFNNLNYRDLNQPIYPIFKPKYLPDRVHTNYNKRMYYRRGNVPTYIDNYNGRRGNNFYNMYKK